MQTTSIGWTEATWNPVRGCTRVSEGCRHCYAETMAARFSDPGMWGHGFAKRTKGGARWTGRVELVTSKLEEPLRWKKPRMVFVNSTSDLWHEKLRIGDVARVYDVMRKAPQHTFQVLTKRPARRRDAMMVWSGLREANYNLVHLANVWEGTSIELNQHVGRAVELRATPAAVRFLSLEPLLGALPDLDLTRIDWVIIGGESGHGARRMNPAWVENILIKAEIFGVPVFVKQLGSVLARELGGKGKGEDMATWPDRWRRREWPIGRCARITP